MASTRSDAFEKGQLRPDTVSDVLGLEVYTSSGTYVGTVEDLDLDFGVQETTGLALTDVNREIKDAVDNSARGVIVPYNWVNAVHDIVITIDILQRLEPK